jgi:cytochrome b involved in lipid metabolism
MKKSYIGVLIFILAVGIFLFIRLSSTSYESQNYQGLVTSTTKNATTQTGTTLNSISLETLSKHNSINDCWVAYNNKVYDISSFLPVHPGSAGAISPYCGTSDEFTQAFTAQHGKSQVSKLMKVGVLIGDFQIKGGL